MRRTILSLSSVVLLAGGCPANEATDDDSTTGVPLTTSADDAGDGTTTMGLTSATSTPTNDDTGASVTTGPSPSDDTDDPEIPIKFDHGALPDAPMLDMQCTKVDFLFVIDNSGSMYSYQQQLVNNFPTFIAGIQDSLEDVSSYQVGVVTSDAYTYNIAGCQDLSSLVVQTGGSDSSNSMCGPYSDGDNFMTESDDLSTSFSCAAQIGTSGDAYERPMQAMVEAVQKVDGGNGECNDNFLRDDALLVVVIITDEYDGPGDPEGAVPYTSTGDPTSWYDAVVAAKNGIPENVVIMSMVNYYGGPCPPSANYYDCQHIVDFTQMFGENGFVGGICETDWAPLFAEAIGVIENACENFIPPG